MRVPLITSQRLAGFYLLFFLAAGVTLPFLPAYFQSLGLTASQIGIVLSVNPVFSLLMPPLWGQLADRTGRPGLVLLVLCIGMVFGYTVLLGATGFVTTLLSMALYAVFGSSVTTIIDSLSLQHTRASGGSYAHLRRWGSIGFVMATLVFGYLVSSVDRWAVLTPIAILIVTAVWCALTLARAPRIETAGPRPTVQAAAALLKNPALLWLLAATTLHWVAATPFHGSLSRHYTSMGFAPWAVSLTWAVAVSSEIVVMTLWPKWSHMVSARTLLTIVFLVSAVRWFGMSMTSNVVVLTLLATLHGLMFGAFYVAAVAQVEALVPSSLRATGQALFVALTFGFGGIAGFSASGLFFQHFGGHRLFLLAAVIELLPIAVVWRSKGFKSPENNQAART